MSELESLKSGKFEKAELNPSAMGRIVGGTETTRWNGGATTPDNVNGDSTNKATGVTAPGDITPAPGPGIH